MPIDAKAIPDISDYRRELAFKAGKKAGQSGKPETANKRQRGTIYFDDWWDGWNEGQRVKP